MQILNGCLEFFYISTKTKNINKDNNVSYFNYRDTKCNMLLKTFTEYCKPNSYSVRITGRVEFLVGLH